MSTDKYLTYRGNIKAAVGTDATVAFVPLHPEGQPTGVYRLDSDKLTVAVDPLPVGGVDLIADGDTLWVAGSDAKLYQHSARGGTPKPFGPTFATVPAGL